MNIKLVKTLALVFFLTTMIAGSLAFPLESYSTKQDIEVSNGTVSIAEGSVAGQVEYKLTGDATELELRTMYIEGRFVEAEFLNVKLLKNNSTIKNVISSYRINSTQQRMEFNSSVDAVRLYLERNTESGLSPKIIGVSKVLDQHKSQNSTNPSTKKDSFLSNGLIDFIASLFQF